MALSLEFTNLCLLELSFSPYSSVISADVSDLFSILVQAVLNPILQIRKINPFLKSQSTEFLHLKKEVKVLLTIE